MTTSTGAPPPAPRPPSPWRSLPTIDEENRAFWTGGADGRLHIARCQDCRTWIHPPVPFCHACAGLDVQPEPVSGRGTVYSFTVNVHPWSPELPVPYVYAIVALDEQNDIRMTTNVVDCDPYDVTIDMPVEVRFEDHGEVFLPVFVPAEARS